MEDAIKDAFEEDKSGLGNAVACGVVWRAVLHGVRRYVACGITWRANNWIGETGGKQIGLI